MGRLPPVQGWPPGIRHPPRRADACYGALAAGGVLDGAALAAAAGAEDLPASSVFGLSVFCADDEKSLKDMMFHFHFYEKYF